jgi:hypothetical protein
MEGVILDVLAKPTPGMIAAGAGPGAMCREDAEGAWADMIRAAKEGK